VSRSWWQPNVPAGCSARQLFLADSLDTSRIAASYDAGVLTLKIPIAEKAKPRKISIQRTGPDRQMIDA